MAAAAFSELLGKRNRMREFKNAANEIKEAAMTHLYSPALKSFVRGAVVEQGEVRRNEVIDASSLFGLWYFDFLPQDHQLFKDTLQATLEKLHNPTPVGGFIRYENDGYFKSTDKPNPWFITTLWEAQRRLRQTTPSPEDLQYVQDTLEWVVGLMYPSGVLAEQVNPYTRESLSATPLAWSHAVYVETVLDYLHALKELDDLARTTASPHQL